MNRSDLTRLSVKSPTGSLAHRLMQDVGLSPAQIRIVVELIVEYFENYYDEHRSPGVIAHTAVSSKEPAGKPLDKCELVAVRLTTIADTDHVVLHEDGAVELRMLRLFRLCDEARRQGGLLSQEDLAVLLGVDRSTIKSYVAVWRKRGLTVPTRGAIKDIGPDPSHKQQIANLLGRGYSTTKVRTMTQHSEGSIGSYQQQFGLVIYLLETYPDASDDQRCQLANLSRKAYDTYVEVYLELAQRPDCRPHLTRLRRRYELDPNNIGQRGVAPGKTPTRDALQRLQAQKLDTSIRQTIQDDLATTKRVAEVVTEDIMALIVATFLLTDQVRPGEVVVFADAGDPAYLSGEQVADRPVIPARIPLYTQEIQEVWRSDEPVAQRRARIAAMIATAVQEQGGIMSVAKLAELLHVHPSTMSKDLRKLAVELHIQAPTKGLIEDAGPTLTHKNWIVDLDNCGLTGEQITWLTRHAPTSRDRYIETYRRAEIIMRLEGQIPDVDHLARVLQLRRHVAQQYVDLLTRFHGGGISQQASGTALATNDDPPAEPDAKDDLAAEPEEVA